MHYCNITKSVVWRQKKGARLFVRVVLLQFFFNRSARGSRKSNCPSNPRRDDSGILRQNPSLLTSPWDYLQWDWWRGLWVGRPANEIGFGAKQDQLWKDNTDTNKQRTGGGRSDHFRPLCLELKSCWSSKPVSERWRKVSDFECLLVSGWSDSSQPAEPLGFCQSLERIELRSRDWLSIHELLHNVASLGYLGSPLNHQRFGVTCEFQVVPSWIHKHTDKPRNCLVFKMTRGRLNVIPLRAEDASNFIKTNA